MNYSKLLLFDFIARDVVIYYKIQISSFTLQKEVCTFLSIISAKIQIFQICKE